MNSVKINDMKNINMCVSPDSIKIMNGKKAAMIRRLFIKLHILTRDVRWDK